MRLAHTIADVHVIAVRVALPKATRIHALEARSHITPIYEAAGGSDRVDRTQQPIVARASKRLTWRGRARFGPNLDTALAIHRNASANQACCRNRIRAKLPKILPVKEAQPTLFELPARVIEPAAVDPALQAVSASLSPALRLGTMSWSFAGWRGLVYGHDAEPKLLAEAGLTAYSRHPLLRSVEVDRSFYDPLPEQYFADLARQVPEDFRFLVKAHEECTLSRFPKHARYGKRQAEPNPRFLDPSYAEGAVVGACVPGLGTKLAAILFQFPPQDAGDPRAFADRLQAFLERLPRGVPYAVELRNAELLTPAYARALTASGALHAHNAWGTMPSLLAQARLIPPPARRPLIVRWLMPRGAEYEAQRSRFLPFDRLVEPDLPTRTEIATLVSKALAHDVPAFVLVNNKAEGCAPASIVELARAIAPR